MSLRNNFLLVFISVLTCVVNAQVKIKYAMDEPDMVLTYMDISKYNTLDSAYLHVTYHLSMVCDTLNPTVLSNDMMTLQIGTNLTKFYSENIHENDSICTELAKKTINLPLNDVAVCQGYEIFNYYHENKRRVTNRMPFSNNVYVYEENLSVPVWKIANESTKILGFNCQKAETEFKGRHYIAWFSSEIPSNSGPWKLGGLPGLILKVSDIQNHYVFECVGISRLKFKKPIQEYQWKSKKISFVDWNKLDKNYHKRAGTYVKSNNVNIVILRNGNWEPIQDEWEMPYNPIEREK
jgi:GLPGLI family protein